MSSSETFADLELALCAAQSSAEHACSGEVSWEPDERMCSLARAPDRSASLPTQLGAAAPGQPPGRRCASLELGHVRAPVLLPCMRVSLEIEPLDLTPRAAGLSVARLLMGPHVAWGLAAHEVRPAFT